MPRRPHRRRSRRRREVKRRTNPSGSHGSSWLRSSACSRRACSSGPAYRWTQRRCVYFYFRMGSQFDVVFFHNTQGAIDDEDDGVDVEAMTYEELTALGEQIGTQSKGLCVEVIDALPVRRYVSTCGGGDGEEEEKCMICIMHFEEGDDVRRVPKCGHEYHPECLTPWLSENKCCPICKTEIDAKEVLSGAEGISA